MMIQRAAAVVACGGGFLQGNGKPIGFGDMSDLDESTASDIVPGCTRRHPWHPERCLRHPWGSHMHGQEIDVAYYQKRGTDNRLVPVCDHFTIQSGRVRDEKHCVKAPDNLDLDRTAVFIAVLLWSNHYKGYPVTLVAVDGCIGPPLIERIEQLYPKLRDLTYRVKFETDPRRWKEGWYLNHHHHFHVSIAPKYQAIAPIAPSTAPHRRCANQDGLPRVGLP